MVLADDHDPKIHGYFIKLYRTIAFLLALFEVDPINANKKVLL